MSNLNDAQIYASQLLPKRHGYPLWVPEPYGNSVTYRTKGVRIGDVGYITEEGAFETLFNVRGSPNDPINWRGVPEGFEQLHIPFEEIVRIPNFHQPGSTVTSASTKKQAVDIGLATPELPGLSPGVGTGFKFTWVSSQGGILHLPDGACRVSSPAEMFRDAAIRGAKSWYTFVNVTLRRGVPNGALYLVTGYDKAQSWMVGAFANRSSDVQTSFKLTAASACDARVSYSYSWETSSPAVFRTGPSELTDSEDTLRQHDTSIARDDSLFSSDTLGRNNQCIFIRGYRIMLRSNPVSLLLGSNTKVEINSISSINRKDIAQTFLERRRDQAHLATTMSRPHTKSDSFQVQQVHSANIGSISSQSESPLVDNDKAILEYLPVTQETHHPSKLINELLLHMCPNASVSVVHDDEWTSLICQDDHRMPNEEQLLSRVLDQYLCVDGGFLSRRQDKALLQSPKTVIKDGLNVSENKEYQTGRSGLSPCTTPSYPTAIANTGREACTGSNLASTCERKIGQHLSEIINTRLPPQKCPTPVRRMKRPRTAPARTTEINDENNLISRSIRREKSFDFRMI